MRLHPETRVAEYTAKGWWSGETFDDLLRAQVAARPDRTAVVDPPNRDSPERLTWAELDERVDRLAVVLFDLGVRKDIVVAVQLPNGVGIAAALLAISRLGAISTPFPVQYREYELSQLVKLANAAVFVTEPQFRERADGLGLPVLTLEHLDVPYDGRLDGYLADLEVDGNDCVTICWTSGTEGTPKGVPRCHNDWLAGCVGGVEAPRLTGDDVLLNPFPMVNMAGFVGMFLPWLRTGAVLVQHQPFDLPVFLQQIAQERVTYTVAPPALLTLLLQREEILAQADISSLRVLGSGSAPLPPAMVRGWQDRHGLNVVNFFGSNEGVALLSDVPDPEERARFFPRPGAEGIEWPSRLNNWMTVRLVDPATDEVITEGGHPGELLIAGPTVFAGYLGPVASPFTDDGFLRTGDLFEYAGNRLQYLR
ncbi:MAG: class I adenylate-forming enzyme family protein, partial [Streptosporangiaceae bacterium]